MIRLIADELHELAPLWDRGSIYQGRRGVFEVRVNISDAFVIVLCILLVMPGFWGLVQGSAVPPEELSVVLKESSVCARLCVFGYTKISSLLHFLAVWSKIRQRISLDTPLSLHMHDIRMQREVEQCLHLIGCPTDPAKLRSVFDLWPAVISFNFSVYV